jgi:hypothetical protein
MTLTFTDLLRTPKQVVERTGSGAVRITRHGSDDLVLVRADDFDHQQAGIALAGRLVRRFVACDGDWERVLVAEFAWARLLSVDELKQFAAQVDGLLWAAVDLGRYAMLLEVLTRWQGTAEVYADGLSSSDVASLDWLDQTVDVPRPF